MVYQSYLRPHDYLIRLNKNEVAFLVDQQVLSRDDLAYWIETSKEYGTASAIEKEIFENILNSTSTLLGSTLEQSAAYTTMAAPPKAPLGVFRYLLSRTLENAERRSPVLQTLYEIDGHIALLDYPEELRWAMTFNQEQGSVGPGWDERLLDKIARTFLV